MTTPFVQYGYANGSANTVRPTEIAYPDGRALAYEYGSAGGMPDALSRIASIVDDDDTHLADYSYLGERSFVVADSPQPQVKWTLPSLSGTNDPDTGDIYSGLDRFGRVKDNRWYDYGSSADVDRIKYGYDRAGNRTWRQNVVADSLSKHFDEVYGNDLIHRLKDLARGTLTAQKDGVTDKSFAECWSLDPTGNWKKYLEDSNGDGSWNLEQSRTANTVNEIIGITESTGPAWLTPAYNAAGNMTTVPQPADPTKSYTATYDAWNRLVKLVDDDTSDVVAEYAYDGANRRIVQKSYDEGDLDETRHLYYTQPSQWQVVEERVDAETDPDRQFVWGLRYIDDLILRDRDTNGDGSLDERLFALQDANWNLTALIDTAGDVQERYAYSAYGTPLFLTPSFGSRASSSFGWETLYAGYRWETATELFHVRHRVLHAVIGTWCQRDPISNDATYLYQYCQSSPLHLIDPWGLGEWMFHPYDHGGPHFQIEVDGVQRRYRATDLSPIKHGNYTPPELSNSAKKKLMKSTAWRNWTNWAKDHGIAFIALYGYDYYMEEMEALGIDLATQIGLCRQLQVLLQFSGNPHEGRRIFQHYAPGVRQVYDVRIVRHDEKCWIVATHSETDFSIWYGSYDRTVYDIEMGECPAEFLFGCDCRLTQGV